MDLALKQSLIYLVSKVHICFMLDQFPDNPHISFFDRHHESCLLRVLELNW